MSEDLDKFLDWNTEKKSEIVEQVVHENSPEQPSPVKEESDTQSLLGTRKQEPTSQLPQLPQLSGDEKRDYILNKLRQDSLPRTPEAPEAPEIQAPQTLVPEKKDLDTVSTTELTEEERQLLQERGLLEPVLETETTKEKSRICIYHAQCEDGFASAYCVNKKFGDEDTDYLPYFHGQELDLDLVRGKKVYIVDFSFRRKVFKDILKEAGSVILLDHHKSAYSDLEGLDKSHSNLEMVFDMNMSGCGITWEYLFPDEEMPDIVEYIQDSDINKMELPNTKQVMAGLRSHPHSFEEWSELKIVQLMREGISITRYVDRNISQIIENCVLRKKICGYNVPVVNASRFIRNAVLGPIISGEKFAASYSDTNSGRIYSLRSDAQGIDVSEIAKKFGGGGHYHAAGFTVNTDNKHLIKKVKNKSSQKSLKKP